jgi:hypothetical protein
MLQQLLELTHKYYRTSRTRIAFDLQSRAHRSLMDRIRRQGKARVAFFTNFASTWRHDDLYQKMAASPHYEPSVVLCPSGDQPSGRIEAELLHLFHDRPNYTVHNLDTNGSWASVDRDINPDIAFFDNPWHLTLPQYDLPYLKNRLCCYFPYTWGVEHQTDWIVNKSFHHQLWAFFVPSIGHAALARELSPIGDRNMVISGHPGIDNLTRRSSAASTGRAPYPITPRIIWAPHHTIPGNGAPLDWSCFLRYSDFMLDTARRASGTVHFVFKPHPLLQTKLALPGYWGERKVRRYWDQWAELGPGAVAEGPYTQVINDSDAMIHDCGSFTAEYLATGKPAMYLWRDPDLPQRFNPVGRIMLDAHYKGQEEHDIEEFISEVVLNNRDPMAAIREEVSNKYVVSPHGGTASDFIFNWIHQSIFGGTVS